MSSKTKCKLCGKEVFLMEQLKLPKGDLLHRNCFKCCECGGFLKVGFYAVEEGKYRCKTCVDKKKAPVVIDASATVTTAKPEVEKKKPAASDPAPASNEEAAPAPAAEADAAPAAATEAEPVQS